MVNKPLNGISYYMDVFHKSIIYYIFHHNPKTYYCNVVNVFAFHKNNLSLLFLGMVGMVQDDMVLHIYVHIQVSNFYHKFHHMNAVVNTNHILDQLFLNKNINIGLEFFQENILPGILDNTSCNILLQHLGFDLLECAFGGQYYL